MEFPLLEACLPVYSFVDIDIIMPACTAVDTFHPLSCDVLSSLISKLNKTTCVLVPFPTKVLMSILVVELSGLQTCKLLSTHPSKSFPRRFSGPESVCSG